MKKRTAVLLLVLILLLSVCFWLGIGPYASGSAVSDLREQLVVLHGEPYSGKITEYGVQSMEFSIKPATFFLTNYNLRNALGWDYCYRCEVIYSVFQGDSLVSENTVTYTGVDPMGPGEEAVRAYLIQE